MKRITFPLSLPAAAFALLALLAGCQPDKGTRVAGGDDIPNDVEPLGKRAAEARSDTTDWNGFKAMPRTAPGMYDTAAIPDSTPDTAGAGRAQPKRAAAKTAGAAGAYALGTLPLDSLPLGKPADTLVTRVVDTAKGAVEAVHAVVKDSVRTVDSTVFVPADPSRPGSAGSVLQVAGRVTFADTALWKTYLFRDADGDGSLAPRAGSANLAEIELASKGGDGLVARLKQRVAAGADLDFNRREDNRLLASLTAVTAGTDTLRIVRLLDADGDSAVIDFSKDTNLVDLIETVRDPGDTGAVIMTVSARLVVYSRDSSRNYAVRYRRAELRKDGGSLVLEGRGPRPDSSFRAGDEAFWTVTRAFPPGGETSLSIRTFAVALGAAPGDFAGDRLLRMDLEARYRKLAYESFAFSLRPAAPVADGHWPAGGEVDASLIYGDGAKTTFTGTADAQGMHGTVQDVSGRAFTLSFDPQGRIGNSR